jgi:hypothetical protein
MNPQINRKQFLIVAGLALVLLAAGAAYAVAQTNGVINACVLKDGTLRIVADPAECKRGETPYTWNITGPKGDPGLACWDLNGNGVQDPAEDINGDGAWNAADCKGPQGETGAAGTDGTNGTNGANGLACWDLNADGIQDAAEDINADAVVDALDCKGPKGDAGDTANVDAVQAEVDALEAEVAALHDQVDYVYSLHSNTVFLSSAVYDGAMGGLGGADAKCQALADAAGLPGTFKAWLSDATGSPSTRFTQSTLRYVRVDGVKVADDWADLTDASLYAPINVTENGDQLSEADPFTWTNTSPSGTTRSVYSTCANWTSNSTEWSKMGRYPAVDVYWTAYGAEASCCNTAHHIYCFEQ